jgi:positive regulator of sigma E activity
MLDQGVVYKLTGAKAWVEMSQAEKCRGCAACQLLAPGRWGIEAENLIDAQAGDRVEVEVTAEAGRLIPLVVFGVPSLGFFVGLLLGNIFSESAGIIFAVVLLGTSFLLVRQFDRWAARQTRFTSRLTRKIA